MSNLIIRRASAADAPAVLQIVDEIIQWLVSIGNDKQWGAMPWSSREQQRDKVIAACSLPGAWVVQAPRRYPIGCLGVR